MDTRRIVLPILAAWALGTLAAGCAKTDKKTKADPWNVPPSAAAEKNPVPATPEAIAAGKKAYDNYCAACHGTDGKGDGPAAAGLTPPPTNLLFSQVKKESDGALYYRITKGHADMPAFQSTLSDKVRWQIVDYIRSLQSKS